MPFRVTNNSTKFILELTNKLQAIPDEADGDCVISFSEIHSLLLDVWSAFILREGKIFRMLVRVWDGEDFNNNLGLYFPDKIRFKEESFLVSAKNYLMLERLLNNELHAPEKLKGILLDGSSYTLSIKHTSGLKNYTWNLPEQLNETLKELYTFIEEERANYF